MTNRAALRAALRAAILKAPFGDEDTTIDAILAAIQPVLDDGFTIDWGVRCAEPGQRHSHAGPMPCWFMSRESAERYVNNRALGLHELVFRRRFLGEWEPMR